MMYNKEKDAVDKITGEREGDMIKLTRLNEEQFVLNAELIKTVEESPNTVITLTTGNKYIVKESADEVVEAVVEYKRDIFRSFME